MDKIAEKIFKNKKLNVAKAEKAGFDRQNGRFVFEQKIADEQFLCKITFSETNVESQIIDIANGLPYTLFLVDGAQGAFVGQVRKEYEKVLMRLVETCYEENIFKTENFVKIKAYIEKKYGDKLEFLWDKLLNCAIWRRKDNNKWYAIVMSVAKEKITGEGKEIVEILNLKSDNPKQLIDNKNIFNGYHMNKKYWVSVLLNGDLCLENVYDLIDTSFALVGRK